MRASRMNIVTLREDPADAEIASHKLLIRSGFMYKSGAGLYLYGPLLKRVIDKIARIVAEEISEAGGLEVTMPIMQEQGLWEASGRWELFQATRTMLTVTDRGGQSFGLAPTAEEVVTDYAKNQVSSHKQLPVCYFQQHTKFRDEIRPRFGLMRVKEFIMMDAYSFHADEDSLDATYEDMRQAYHRIVDRCGLVAYAVEADTGAIGGSGSHEFMVAAEVGEDTIVYSETSGYGANVERASTTLPPVAEWHWTTDATIVETPKATSIDDVVTLLGGNGYEGISGDQLVKTLLFVAECAQGSATVAACVRGNREANEVKLANAVTKALDPELGALAGIRVMTDDEVRAATDARPGFAGPGNRLKVDICVIDEQIPSDQAAVVGANSDDAHVVGFVIDRDARDHIRADITQIKAGDPCPLSGEPLEERRGIEVGHIFKLGDKYTKSMGAEFTGKDGKRHPMTMGCYGIGTSRMAAAAIEQFHDDVGMKWPLSIAPYHCVVVPAQGKSAECREAAAKIYEDLKAAGVETIYDDRDLGPGVKFKDWELIGIPLTVVVGRGLADGKVEFKRRADGLKEDVPLEAIITKVTGEL